MTELERRMQNVLRRVFRQPELQLTRNLSAWDIPGWDSLTNMQLILDIEIEFAVRFSAAEVSALKSAGDLLDSVQRKIEAKSGSESQ